jgi:F-box-like
VEAALRTATLPINQGVHKHISIAEGQYENHLGRYKRLIALSIAPSIQYSPIDRLPTEILLYIFRFGNPDVKSRVRLTHVCQHWRDIAIVSGSLWTSIDIRPASTASNEQFANFISLLNLQFVRTQNLPLDVVWHVTENINRNITVIPHIEKNGPFHRWKSLTFSAQSICPFHSPDGFPNLESLTILSLHAVNVILQINRTTISKLRSLDISQSGAYDHNVDSFYGPILHRITRLALSSVNPKIQLVTLTPFPANIVEIEAERRSKHPFPHVNTYKLTQGIFREDHIIDLPRLTTLVITGSFSVYRNCQLVLPSLRSLVCTAISLAHNAILDAPVLEAIEFRDDLRYIPDTQSRFSYIEDVLAHPGYLLSPTKSLLLDASLPPNLIVTILTWSSRLEKATLRVDADTTVWNVTAAMSSGDTNRTEVLCPQLTELRFRIAQEYRDRHGVDWWREQAAQMVRGRRGLSAALHVYGAWDEGETFMLLT